ELLEICEREGMTIAELAWQNEVYIHGEVELTRRLNAIWNAMQSCIEQGLVEKGVLPGYLAVTRRAADMAERLAKFDTQEVSNEWLQAYAIAVNEQNAAGMRVVTAPTNGAAGIIPAVGYYAMKFKGVASEKVARDYLLVAGAIGSLYKRNASISGAEAGCQGEVGSACSMAAAGLASILGATNQQIENAAEIAMEHNLGLTCDPVGGFVQMPCIERNAIASGTAVSAVRLALLGDGSHKISLDTVIETMRQTGIDMSSKYKETSLGGLAVNVVEC
ncbi:MAG: L-serine ammonia-lyase, partial [Acidobacteria bacterium]|nr:L-serine ammonia-lyase [Acidobacteriota bacterium]